MMGHPDPMMNFPSSTVFSIYAVAANVGLETIQVTPRLFFSMAGENNSLALPKTELQPGEAKQIPVSQALKDRGMSDMGGMPNLSLSYTGKESELLATAGSIDQTGTYVLESLFSVEQETPSGSLCYWTLASGTHTMYNVWNPTASKQDLKLRLYYSGGTYEIPISLAPDMTQMIDLKELTMEGTTDSKGHQFPANLEEGSAKLEASGGDDGRMKVVATGATYNVLTATCIVRCINCNGVSTYVITPSPISLPIPDTTTASATVTWNTGQSGVKPAIGL